MPDEIASERQVAHTRAARQRGRHGVRDPLAEDPVHLEVDERVVRARAREQVRVLGEVDALVVVHDQVRQAARRHRILVSANAVDLPARAAVRVAVDPTDPQFLDHRRHGQQTEQARRSERRAGREIPGCRCSTRKLGQTATSAAKDTSSNRFRFGRPGLNSPIESVVVACAADGLL